MDKLTTILFEDAKNVTDKLDFNELNNKSILLTGATGLVGIHILGTLLFLIENKGFNINVTAIIKSKSPQYFNVFDKHKNIDILQGDLTNLDFVNELPLMDYIIHAAGYAQPQRFMSNPVKTIQLNTCTTIALIEKLEENGKFLFISTSELYSGLEKVPFSESDIGNTNTDHPRSCYIEGKRSGEAIVNAYRDSGVEAKSIRLSLAYGPGTRHNDKRVMSNFIQKAIKNNEITLLDHGLAKRTYCYISDVIEYIWLVLFQGKQNVYNVGGYSETTIGELAKAIGSEFNVPVNFPENINEVKGSPNIVKIDIERVENEFGKKDYITLKTGLTKTINWYKILLK
jgi:UDP-glucuronate decarboxylase